MSSWKRIRGREVTLRSRDIYHLTSSARIRLIHCKVCCTCACPRMKWRKRDRLGRREQLWPSGKGLLWLVSVRRRFGSPLGLSLSFRKLGFVGLCLVTLPITINETYWLSSLPVLNAESLRWRVCSVGLVSLPPPPPQKKRLSVSVSLSLCLSHSLSVCLF